MSWYSGELETVQMDEDPCQRDAGKGKGGRRDTGLATRALCLNGLRGEGLTAPGVGGILGRSRWKDFYSLQNPLPRNRADTRL